MAARKDAEIASATRQADAWKAMKHFWDEISPQRIDEEMCRSYSKHGNQAAATIRYELGMLAVALRWAVARS